MSNMSDIINNTPEGKKAVEKAVRQSIADQEAMSNTTEDNLAPTEWLIDDLVTTILDASPEELPELHAKLTALAGSIDTHGLITQAKKDLLAEVREKMPNAQNGKGRVFTSNLAGSAMGEGYKIGVDDALAAIKEIEEQL